MGNQILWISSDMTPPHGYPMGHIVTSFKIHELLKDGNISQILWGNYIYPPLVHIYSGIFYSFSGYSVFNARLSLIFLLPIYIYFTFLIGLNIGGRAAAWLSAITAACAPLILLYLQEYYLEFPLAVILIVCVYLLLKTDNFENKKYCILLGVFSGIGFLVKMNFLFYFYFLIPIMALFNIKLLRLSLITYLTFFAAAAVLIRVVMIWLVHPPMRLAELIHAHPILTYLIVFTTCIGLAFLLNNIEKKFSPEKKERYAPAFGLLNFVIFHGAIILPWFIALLPTFKSYSYIISKVLPPPLVSFVELLPRQLETISTAFPGAIFFFCLGLLVFIYLSFKDKEFLKKFNILLSMFVVVIFVQLMIIFRLRHISMEYPVPTIALLALCSFFYIDRIKITFIRAALILILGLSAIWSATGWLFPDWVQGRFPLKYIKVQSSPRILFEPKNFNFRFQLFEAVADRITNRMIDDANQTGNKSKIELFLILEQGEFSVTGSFQESLDFQCIRKGIKLLQSYVGPEPEKFYARKLPLSDHDYILADVNFITLHNLAQNPDFIEVPDKFKLKGCNLKFKFIGQYKILLHLEGKLNRPPVPLYLYRVIK
ncbi:MAG: hypothetical protein M1269_00810 [Chloroflexi bacterium]|nr:hypothetical protein [Chloroflexota bacterium]